MAKYLVFLLSAILLASCGSEEGSKDDDSDSQTKSQLTWDEGSFDEAVWAE